MPVSILYHLFVLMAYRKHLYRWALWYESTAVWVYLQGLLAVVCLFVQERIPANKLGKGIRMILVNPPCPVHWPQPRWKSERHPNLFAFNGPLAHNPPTFSPAL